MLMKRSAFPKLFLRPFSNFSVFTVSFESPSSLTCVMILSSEKLLLFIEAEVVIEILRESSRSSSSSESSSANFFLANFGVTIHCLALPILRTPHIKAPVYKVGQIIIYSNEPTLYKHIAFSNRT